MPEQFLALPSSFRDPSGFLFTHQQHLYRQINSCYAENYQHLMDSGLYAALVKAKLLIPHEEVTLNDFDATTAFKIIQPEKIQYISYPYEWCFSQLKDAALATLRIQKIALRYGMVLKDASAYNIQFHRGKPLLIDTLSFELYREGGAWVAYKQFCQHFLAPLALMSHCDVRLQQLLRTYIDGIPLGLASRLLPKRSYLSYALLSHIHLHAKTQTKYADSALDNDKSKPRPISKTAFSALLAGINSAVEGIHWKLTDTEWGDYYSATNYQTPAMDHKELLVGQFIQSLSPAPLLTHDLGANNGHFSRLAATLGMTVISQDIDPVAVEKNYLAGKKEQQSKILALVLDLTNPSSSMGWALEERMSFLARADSENNLVLALALIHHLCISNNVPLSLAASFFSRCCQHLIIEFVPKGDSQVQRLLASREDIFPDYTQQGFEKAFSQYFKVEKRDNIDDCQRTLYLMSRLP
ncbi:MAG: hypothetical protein COC19_02855 [SAR86 cluster bacterium]|uniref:SAM-dependent methyltransferase n=1 Tax=SAR86 cluster bacterium TaxID=2030880 RepID=A0A2A4MQV0_9GAMM|nr:MAG: hypothetical protein COC19_02855 [SAR86 cluster bacterium]